MFSVEEKIEPPFSLLEQKKKVQKMIELNLEVNKFKGLLIK